MSRDEGFLKRWSRLKSTADAAAVAPAQATANAAAVAPAQAGAESSSAPSEPPAPPPPIQSLTPESDFTPFMRAGIDRDLRASALKKLFADPRFNVMDGLDVYIDDYSKPDPLPEGWLEKMNQVARLGVFQPEEKAKEPESETPPGVEASARPPALPEPETPSPQPSSNPAERPAPPVEKGR